MALKCPCCGLNLFLEQNFWNQFLLPQHLCIVLKYLLFYLSNKVMRSCKILLKKWTCQKLPLSWKKVRKKTTEQVRSMCLKLLLLSNTINNEVISICRKNGLYPGDVKTMPSLCEKCLSQFMLNSDHRINNDNWRALGKNWHFVFFFNLCSKVVDFLYVTQHYCIC